MALSILTLTMNYGTATPYQTETDVTSTQKVYTCRTNEGVTITASTRPGYTFDKWVVSDTTDRIDLDDEDASTTTLWYDADDPGGKSGTVTATYTEDNKYLTYAGLSTVVDNINANYVSKSRIYNYSTTEQLVGTWIDGKPLYRKYFEGSLPIPSQAGSTATNYISIPEEIDYAFVEQAWIDRTAVTSPQIQPIPHVAYVNNTFFRQTCNIVFYYNSGMATGTTKAIRVWNSDNTATSQMKICVILSYTKTTDTANQ